MYLHGKEKGGKIGRPATPEKESVLLNRSPSPVFWGAASSFFSGRHLLFLIYISSSALLFSTVISRGSRGSQVRRKSSLCPGANTRLEPGLFCLPCQPGRVRAPGLSWQHPSARVRFAGVRGGRRGGGGGGGVWTGAAGTETRGDRMLFHCTGLLHCKEGNGR